MTFQSLFTWRWETGGKQHWCIQTVVDEIYINNEITITISYCCLLLRVWISWVHTKIIKIAIKRDFHSNATNNSIKTFHCISTLYLKFLLTYWHANAQFYLKTTEDKNLRINNWVYLVLTQTYNSHQLFTCFVKTMRLSNRNTFRSVAFFPSCDGL